MTKHQDRDAIYVKRQFDTEFFAKLPISQGRLAAANEVVGGC